MDAMKELLDEKQSGRARCTRNPAPPQNQTPAAATPWATITNATEAPRKGSPPVNDQTAPLNDHSVTLDD